MMMNFWPNEDVNVATAVSRQHVECVGVLFPDALIL